MRTLSNFKLTRRQNNLRDGSQIITGARLNSDNVGAVPLATVVATEYGDGMHHITLLTLTDHIVGAPGAGANLAIGSEVYAFPAGVHAHQISRFNLGLTAGTIATDTPDMGLGSVVGAGAIAVLNGTTMEDYITGQTWAVALDGTLQACAPVGARAGINTGISLNDTGDVKEVFLNAADGWHATITGNLTATGTIVLIWDTVV